MDDILAAYEAIIVVTGTCVNSLVNATFEKSTVLYYSRPQQSKTLY